MGTVMRKQRDAWEWEGEGVLGSTLTHFYCYGEAGHWG